MGKLKDGSWTLDCDSLASIFCDAIVEEMFFVFNDILPLAEIAEVWMRFSQRSLNCFFKDFVMVLME